ncbi:MAG: hypothetical protein SX243_09395 [Acidobacteriota bacterium]|nr:hypothetical protein [Acidobacteriota bacterium]
MRKSRRRLQGEVDTLTAAPSISRAQRRFLPVLRTWLGVVEDEEADLARLERDSPQVPLVFVPGAPVSQTEQSLFVGREDVAQQLDQDLATERPVPLVLLGQRRLGKSTLVNFLPRLLGTGTRVVARSFQGLSGEELKDQPHRLIELEVQTELMKAGLRELASPPGSSAWSKTLRWLESLEEPLEARQLRLLVAIDEVEGLERGIKDGWGDPSFLDFVRAAGDRLLRTRFLLITAQPFSRLGPHWSDRLISAQIRRLKPLEEEDARRLLTEPVPNFPDIYPDGGVERLIEATGCHPYLLQLTAYQLVQRLNTAQRLKATDDDLTAALDRALEENNLFQNLWDDFTEAERQLMAAMARGGDWETSPTTELNRARTDLARELYIRKSADEDSWQISVPLFAEWICEIGAPS